jgi:hypothetical protein
VSSRLEPDVRVRQLPRQIAVIDAALSGPERDHGLSSVATDSLPRRNQTELDGTGQVMWPSGRSASRRRITVFRFPSSRFNPCPAYKSVVISKGCNDGAE